MNKVICGKQLNCVQRGGYYNRCHAAVLAYNDGSFRSEKILEKICHSLHHLEKSSKRSLNQTKINQVGSGTIKA